MLEQILATNKASAQWFLEHVIVCGNDSGSSDDISSRDENRGVDGKRYKSRTTRNAGNEYNCSNFSSAATEKLDESEDGTERRGESAKGNNAIKNSSKCDDYIGESYKSNFSSNENSDIRWKKDGNEENGKARIEVGLVS